MSEEEILNQGRNTVHSGLLACQGFDVSATLARFSCPIENCFNFIKYPDCIESSLGTAEFDLENHPSVLGRLLASAHHLS